MKKWLSFLALAILPFANAQANTLPNVLVGLDNTSNLEVMNDQQLSEVRGTGNLPSYFAFRDYYYNWNNYGSTTDFRSYIYDGGSTYSGGIDAGTGAWTGERWIVNILGTQYEAEQRSLWIVPDGSGGFLYSTTLAGWSVSNAAWTGRSWSGNIHYHQDYNNTISYY